MRIIPRVMRRARPIDGIAPGASVAPHKPAGRYPADGYTPLALAPEDPFLLRDYPRADMPPSCLILGGSRAEHEHQRRTAAVADTLGYEAAVAEAVLILHPGDATAAGYLAVLNAALPVVCDRRTLPLAMTR